MGRPCTEAMAILADPRTADRESLARAKQHATPCPVCSGVMEDGVMSRPTSTAPVVPVWLRFSLAFLATVQLLVAVPWIYGLDPIGGLGDHVDVAHLTRDGALGLATSVAGLLTAWRVRYAIPSVAVAAAALAVQLVMAFVDDHSHAVTMAFEGVHLITVAVTALVAIHVRHSKLEPRSSQEDEPLRLV